MTGDPSQRSPSQVSTTPAPALGHVTALIRHFVDLRDGTHGGSFTREDKEGYFAQGVVLLAPVARQALGEINTHLLLETGRVVALGLQRESDGGLRESWELSWPEQQSARIGRVSLVAYYGAGFHHPHLRGATVGDWPLNVFTEHDAADQLTVLRAIATAELHNLVFQADYRIIPAVTRPPSEPQHVLPA